MTDASMLRAPLTTSRVTPALVLEAWRGITGRQLARTFLLGLGLFVYHAATGLALGEGAVAAAIIGIADQIKVFSLLLMFVVADRATGEDPSRRGAYVLAAAAGAAVGGALAVLWTSSLYNLLIRPAAPRVQFMVYIGLELALLGFAVFWVINDRRRARRARARMHAAELERIGAQKRSIELDLQAMQARVEPQFLFSTLGQVRQLYERDLARGERMLDELIAYLRAAMPRMRDSSSTVGQEIDLARAYLAIVKVRLGEGLDYELESAAAAADARMPPMMLLPLVDRAIGPGPGGSLRPELLRIRAGIADGGVRVELAASGAAFPLGGDDDTIVGIRDRLAALYGDSASLALEPRGGGSWGCILRFPLEPPPSSA